MVGVRREEHTLAAALNIGGEPAGITLEGLVPLEVRTVADEK
jgi:hypothetical protein